SHVPVCASLVLSRLRYLGTRRGALCISRPGLCRPEAIPVASSTSRPISAIVKLRQCVSGGNVGFSAIRTFHPAFRPSCVCGGIIGVVTSGVLYGGRFISGTTIATDDDIDFDHDAFVAMTV